MVIMNVEIENDELICSQFGEIENISDINCLNKVPYLKALDLSSNKTTFN